MIGISSAVISKVQVFFFFLFIHVILATSPGITVMVDCALKVNYLSVFLSRMIDSITFAFDYLQVPPRRGEKRVTSAEFDFVYDSSVNAGKRTHTTWL